MVLMAVKPEPTITPSLPSIRATVTMDAMLSMALTPSMAVSLSRDLNASCTEKFFDSSRYSS